MVAINEHVRNADHASRTWLTDSSKFAINQRNVNDVIIAIMTSTPFFKNIRFFIVQFSY